MLMLFRRLLSLGLLICAALSNLEAQESNKPISARDIDFSAFVKETQQQPNEPGYAGLVWWIPTQFWELSAQRSGVPEDRAEQRYEPLRKYTVVAVALGKIGVGNINWVSEPDIRDNVLLRDSEGNTYPAVQKLSGDAEGLSSILKPVFANILGAMGQNIQLLFFPATNKMAKPIADPLADGSFSIVISNVLGGKQATFEWKLPLTNLSLPKYCPLGKEPVQANWKYCPWHGVSLDPEASVPPKMK